TGHASRQASHPSGSTSHVSRQASHPSGSTSHVSRQASQPSDSTGHASRRQASHPSRGTGHSLGTCSGSWSKSVTGPLPGLFHSSKISGVEQPRGIA
ncbi:MAG: hypothetical protein WBE58_07620, partial [Verrucomicrobiales bacterium]